MVRFKVATDAEINAYVDRQKYLNTKWSLKTTVKKTGPPSKWYGLENWLGIYSGIVH